MFTVKPLGLAFALCSLSAQAAPPTSLYFAHKDWLLVCDNTRTCRAVGYHADNAERHVALMLTRKAGPNQPVEGELMLGDEFTDESLAPLPKNFDQTMLTMRVNGRALGKMNNPKLSRVQIAVLLAALPHSSEVAWKFGKIEWNLSDAGAAAVLLKMDEFQGRIGTPGALVKKGQKSEDAVLPALPAPIVTAMPLAKPLPGDPQIASNNFAALHKALRTAITKDDDCNDLDNENLSAKDITVERLTASKILVSTSCWRGAYNFGSGYWVADDQPPYRAVLVTNSGSDYSPGSISGNFKGRGIGDCWSGNTWTWDGTTFVHTEQSSTGMCKLMGAGGAWTLPEITTEVRSNTP